MHCTHSPAQPLSIHWLVAEVKIISESIICNAVLLYAITYPLVLSTSSLVLALPLHPTGLLFDREILIQAPHLLPNITVPPEELIYFEIGELCFGGRFHQRILSAKEVTERPVLLLISYTKVCCGR